MKLNRTTVLVAFFAVSVLIVTSCRDEKPEPPAPIQEPTPFSLSLPSMWPPAKSHPQNPLTVEGIALGKKLFFDPILSRNQTQSCASCHNQAFGFTDFGKKVSLGSEGDIGTMNSMPLYNLNWNSGFFWNGRAKTLEDLVREPIEAHFEMNLTMEEAEFRLQNHKDYPELFKKAFPRSEISILNIQFAIAQYLKTIISGNTKWDEYVRKNPRNPENFMTPAQKRGYTLFINEEKGDCFHCHSPLNHLLVNLNEREFSNNGLDAKPDTGYLAVTGNPMDYGKFKVPSLRNLAFTAPYMHDGRFETLMQVLDHYDTGFNYSPTLDAMLLKHVDLQTLKPIKRLTVQEKQDIIEYLMLLTDSTLLTNPAYKP
jgi:cytochrome c peroxidase